MIGTPTAPALSRQRTAAPHTLEIPTVAHKPAPQILSLYVTTTTTETGLALVDTLRKVDAMLTYPVFFRTT